MCSCVFNSCCLKAGNVIQGYNDPTATWEVGERTGSYVKLYQLTAVDGKDNTWKRSGGWQDMFKWWIILPLCGWKLLKNATVE